MAGTGQVERIAVTAGGTGYSTAPTVTLTAPAAGTTATAQAVVSSAGAVIAVLVLTPGTGYSSAPTVSFGGPGTGAAASAVLGLPSYSSVADFRDYLPEIASAATDAQIQKILDRATAICNDSEVGLGFAFAGYTVEARAIAWTQAANQLLPVHLGGSVSRVELGGAALTPDVDYAVVPALNGRHEALYRLGLANAPGWWLPGGVGDVWQTSLPAGSFAWQAPPGTASQWLSYYVVTAAWGYGPPPVSVQEVCLELAVNIWQSRKAGRFSNIIGPSDGGGVGYEGAATPLQRSVLAGVRDQYSQELVPL